MLPALRALVSLTLPIAAGTLCSALLSLSDTLMAGLAGSADLAGAAAGGALYFPALMLLSGLLSAHSAALGRLQGAGASEAETARAFAAALLSAVLTAAVLCLVLIAAALVIEIKSDPAINHHFTRYLIFAALSLPDAALLFTLKASCEALGAPRLSFLAGLIMLGLNLPLNFLCIFGLGPLPGLGGAGCGLATLLAVSGSAGLLLLAVYKRCPQLWTRLNPLSLNAEPGAVKAFLREALPLGLAAALESSAFALIALLLTPLGASAAAGHSIAMSINSLIFVLPLSLGIAGCITVSQALGAQSLTELKQAQRALGLTSLCLMTLILGFTLTTKDYLPHFFTHDAKAAALASALLSLAAVSQIFEHLQCVLSFQLRAFKQGRLVLLTTLSCFYALALPLGLLLCYRKLTPPYLDSTGPRGFWLALIAALALAALCYGLRLRRCLRQLTRDA